MQKKLSKRQKHNMIAISARLIVRILLFLLMVGNLLLSLNFFGMKLSSMNENYTWGFLDYDSLSLICAVLFVVFGILFFEFHNWLRELDGKKPLDF